MTTTKAAVRRRAVALARANGRGRGFSTRDGVNALVATAGAARTLTSTSGLPPSGAPTTLAKNEWIYLPTMAAAYQKRIVLSYDADAQKLTHNGPDYDATTITALGLGTTPFLVLKDDPDLWDSAINEAMQTLLSSIHFDEWTPTVNNKVRYTVSAAPITLTSIVRRTQILALDTHDVNDASGEEHWVPWANGYRTWEAYVDEGAVILDFKDPARAPTTSDVMRIKWAAQFAVPSTETVSIAIDEHQAALATCVQMADWLADPDNPSDDWNIIGRRVRVQYETWRRLNLGPDAYRQVTRTSQQTGIAGVRGRAGR